jgi:hypothetical protein
LLSSKNGSRGNLMVVLSLLFLMLVPIANSLTTYTATVVITPIQWLSGWDKRVKIIIDPTDVDAPLSDFPVLIYFSSNSGANNDDVTFIFDELQNDANRKKIAVTTDDKISQCYVEIERWDTSSEQAWLWVKVPAVNDTAETALYLYYDRDHADNTDYVGDPDSTPAENVWNSNFKLATHMNDNPDISYIRDSTSNDNDGTKEAFNNPIQTDGIIGKAQDFVDDHINCGTGSTLNIVDTLTIEAWINPDSSSTVHQSSIVDRGNSYWFLILRTSNTLAFLRFRGGSFRVFATTATIPTGTYTHVAVEYDTFNADEVKLFINGQLSREGSLDGPIDNISSAVLIGDRGPNVHPFDGIIDEVRISNMIRGVAWIRASYESGRDNFLGFSSEEIT